MNMTTAGATPPPQESDGVVVLLSGGLDSAVMAAIALERPQSVWPLFVRQGFVWEDEEIAAIGRFLASLGAGPSRGLQPLSVARLSVPLDFSSQWALDSTHRAPDDLSPDEAVYLPGRNLALLTQAAVKAYSVGARRIQLGVLDGNPFPDATHDFFDAFEAAAYHAMQWGVSVERPLQRLTKTEVLERGVSYALELTMSCIRPRSGVHCGACNKCAERMKAFAGARIADPTRYASR